MRFTAAQSDLIKEAAAAEGVTAATWIGELVTFTLEGGSRGVPYESLRELVRLRASIVELAGRASDGGLVALPEAVLACLRVDEAASALMVELRRSR